MKIHEIAIVITVLAVLTLSLTGFLTNLGGNYGKSANTTALNNLTKDFDNMNTQAQNISKQVNDFFPEEDESGSGLDLPYKFLRTGWLLVTYFWTSFTTLGNIINTLIQALVGSGISINPMFGTAAFICLVITAVAIVAYAFFKWKFEDK